MSFIYTQKSSPVQKAADSKVASVLDSSAQSESLQRKADMANNAAQRAEAPRPNNTGMPDNLKAGIESLSGFSMDDVRVHYNSSKPATVQALAYTQGTDIHVAPGQEKCLPHEAWHVAQQMAGRVSPTTNINGMPVNDNAALVHEADVMGEKAVGQRKSEICARKKVCPDCKNIQRMNVGLKFENLDLDEEESHGGHTINRHVVARDQVIKRVQNEGQAPSSYWKDKEKACDCIKSGLKRDWFNFRRAFQDLYVNHQLNYSISLNIPIDVGAVLYESLDEIPPDGVRMFFFKVDNFNANLITAYPEFNGTVDEKYRTPVRSRIYPLSKKWNSKEHK